MAMGKEPKPSRFQIWKLAARPHTLTASVAPVFVGYALTLRLIQQNPVLCGSTDERDTCNNNNDDDDATASTALLFMTIQFAAFAGLIQISTNLHNDYADFVKGADTEKRVGQARATQKGWLTPYETCRGCVVCLMASLFIGMQCLIPMNVQCLIGSSRGSAFDPIMIFIVLSSLFNAVAYTGGPFPLGYIGLGNISIGYSGLGDLFVFLYFGIVATVSVPYLYVTKIACISPLEDTSKLLQILQYPFLCSIPIGFLATNIIVVNNLRDRHTDIHAGKRTMAVRFGATFAKMEYLLLVVGSYAFCVYFWMLETESVRWTMLLPLLSLPMSIPQLKAVAFGGKDGQQLNEHVGGAAKLQLVYCILMTAGCLIANRR